MEYQTSLFRGQPDNEAMRWLTYYEKQALEADPRGYCVCTSEGKDSRIVGHLMRRAGVKHFYVHNNTGIDPPELFYFMRRNFQEYRDMGYLTYNLRSQYTIWQLMMKKRFPPLRQIRYCCEYLKEFRAAEQGNAFISLGVRRAESTNRKNNRAELEISDGRKSQTYTFDNTEGRNEFELCATYRGEKRVNPIAEWSDADVWAYSKEQKLEQCCLYAEGFKRLGCIGCPMAGEAQRRREFDRWPGFKYLFLLTFDRIIKFRAANGLGPLLTVGENTAQGVFEWWLTDAATEKVDENQLDMWKWETDEYVR